MNLVLVSKWWRQAAHLSTRVRVFMLRVRVYFPVFMYVCVCMCKRVPEAAFKPKWNAELRNMTPLRPVKLKL